MSGRVLVAGTGKGPLLALAEPLSFWGGLDPETGIVIERRHPQFGVNLAGTVLAMPVGRGSSSSSSVLAEALRLGTGPAAILLSSADEIVMLGSLVAGELYGRACPVVVVERLPDAAADGWLEVVASETATITPIPATQGP